jgi:hypothetical protein
MIRLVLAFLCFILAVGCIDGPSGYESDWWAGCFGFMFTGIALFLWALRDGKVAELNEIK